MEEEKPYWMNLRGGTQFSGELRYSLENYFPDAHYQKAVDEAFKEQAEKRPEPDGGTTNLHTDDRRSTVYYWLNPDTGAALYHTEVNGDEADPFFGSADEAEQFLEKRGGQDTDRYQGFSLYKANVQKIIDAVNVLTDQSDITDFW